jgi:asparagine synthase (glutamine-hydrolysing)
MADTLVHRGPDGGDVWVDEEVGLGFGHRRLSILDLSPAGRQPMRSRSGRFLVAYNGEIYNTSELIADLEKEGCVFRGHSDTEVLIEAIDSWGLVPALKRSVGMFAFALWDAEERVLHLVRDRLGIKPLYYGWVGKTLLFGSELKALRKHPAWDGRVSRDALSLQMRHCYVPAPWSIYEGIYKLMPGCVLSIPLGVDASVGFSPLPVELSEYARLQPESFWDAGAVFLNGAENPFQGSEDEAQEQVEEVLKTAVGQRMIADVPLGAFLSGGVDSSVVVALMQTQSALPVRTFSIGFETGTLDESGYAAELAQRLGTDHTMLVCTAEQALDVVPELPTYYDEPFSDSSQIPTTILSRLTRSSVTVALSGDGGDEVFAGYRRYVLAPYLWKRSRKLPSAVRAGLAGFIRSVPNPTWDWLYEGMAPLLPQKYRGGTPGLFAEKLGGTIGAKDPDAIYQFLTSSWKKPEDLVLGSSDLSTAMNDPMRRLSHDDFLLRMRHGDLVAYLPDDILVKVDRASMAASLEVRVPLLDHRVVELVSTLPPEFLLKGDQTKRPLRRYLAGFMTPEWIDRPKHGFSIPLADWLRGPLRGWAEAQLDPSRLRNEGFLDTKLVRERWEEHLTGRFDWHARLWDVLMFQAWLETQ